MPLAAREPKLEGLRALVVGLGRSGEAAVSLLVGRGARVIAADRRDAASLGDTAARIERLGASLHAGGHPESLAKDADLVVLSPGVPSTTPVVAAARVRGVPVWGEIELAFRFCRGGVVGITGSNGKSTTTAMVGTILRAAGIPGGTGGNLGTPFIELLRDDAPGAVHAVELSSFQLETIEAFHARCAVVTNLSPDHLDRYPSYEAYARAKARILETQEEDEAAVLNVDDPESARFLPDVRGSLYAFTVEREPGRGAFVRRGVMVLRTDAGEEAVMPVAELPVPGAHNVANALAAAVAARLCGASADAVARGLSTFRALPHRLQLVAELDGIAFYDDSKATNLDAAERAIRSFPAGSIHLILGGKDKGADWSSIDGLVRERAKRVLLVGEAAPAIRAGLTRSPLQDCGTIGDAVRAAYDGAAPGDVVLLAPGCASFDQYRNFEERGDDFRRHVLALVRAGGRDA